MTAAQGLFRPEVQQAQRHATLGRIVLRQPRRRWVLTVAALLAGMLLVTFLSTGNYTRRVRVSGQLVSASGLATIQAPVAGVLSRLAVAEGDQVAAGQLLAAIRSPRILPDGGDRIVVLRAQLQRRRLELQRVRVIAIAQQQTRQQGLTLQLQQARAELATTLAESRTQQRQVELSELTLTQWRHLRERNFISDLQWQQQLSAALSQKAQAQSLLRQSVAARRTVAQIAQMLADVPAQGVLVVESVERELATLDREQVELDAAHETSMTAAAPGVVASSLVKEGESVLVGQPLLSVLPAGGQLQAELLVPSRAVGFIRPGDTVRLRYQAFPYQKFGHQPGIVRRISRHALDPTEARALLRGLTMTEPFYRVTVRLTHQTLLAYGKTETLRPGMLLDADVMGDRRRLIEWLLEPLYSLRAST